MAYDHLFPHGDALRRAVRWLSDQHRHDAAAIEEAARRFDLVPADEEFLLRHFWEAPRDTGVDRHPLREDPDSAPPERE